MPVNWNLAGNGNPFADFAEGIQAGRAVKADQRREQMYERRLDLEEKDLQRRQEEESREAEAAKRKRTMEATFQVLNGLKRVPPGKRLQALQAQSPMLARLGIDVNDMLDGTTEEELSDDGIALVTGEVAKAYDQYFQNDSGIYGVKDGAVTRLEEFERKPTIVPQGSVALGADGKPVFANPKTFAPPRPSGGGSRGGGAKPPPAGPRPTGRRF